MIAYLLTQNPIHGQKAHIVAVCTRQTLRKHINFSLRLLGRNRTRGLYTIKKVFVDL